MYLGNWQNSTHGLRLDLDRKKILNSLENNNNNNK